MIREMINLLDSIHAISLSLKLIACMLYYSLTLNGFTSTGLLPSK